MRVLVVEDEQYMARVLKIGLRREATAAVCCARDMRCASRRRNWPCWNC
ncbi:hypothetical protein [Streptomyces jumonjinensis]